MDVDVRMLVELFNDFFRLVERLLEGPGVRPCKIGSVCLSVEVIESVRERHIKAIIVVTPLKTTRASLPLHGVRLDSIDRPQAHFVQLALLSHPFNGKGARVPVLYTFDTEVKPGAIVAHISVGQSIPAHIARKVPMVGL